MIHKRSPFNNPAAIASYAAEAPRKVPGLADLLRMMMLLLAEQAPGDAHILIVGAGGGHRKDNDGTPVIAYACRGRKPPVRGRLH